MAALPLCPAPAGLYVHVPFCARRCAYCDFYTLVREPTAAFVRAVLGEWAVRVSLLAGVSQLATLYLGGGTPGLLDPGLLGALLEGIRRGLPLAPGAEVTVEANPRDVTAERLRAWRDAGVNRVSLGVQSLDEATLRWLGRDHDAVQGRRAVDLVAAAGFASFSADLIFGAPDQTLASVERDARQVAGRVPHVSAYCLTYVEGTPLFRQWEQGRVQPLPSDEEAERYEVVRAALGAGGLHQYEISSYARPGHEAVHNRLYWQGAPTLGLGPAAASYLRHADGTARRWRVAPDLDGYLAGALRDVDVEDLDREEALRDRLFCGVRDMQRGVDLPVLEAEHGVPTPADAEAGLERERRDGAVELVGPRHYRVTAAGALFADRVARAVVG